MFIKDDFLLQNEVSRQLFHKYAKNMPIIDYHCHLDPELIANNFRFTSITELWLSGDHYKWRAMRANGVEEHYITGNASEWEKFKAWASTIENLVGNPLYHWTHLELKTYFGITDLLNTDSARDIYEKCNKYLEENEVTTQSLIRDSKVEFIGTTDDILSDLRYHKQIASTINIKVAPTFRPDPVLNIHKNFCEYLKLSEEKFDLTISTYKSLMEFLKQRMDFFHKNGCKSSDHGLEEFNYLNATNEEIEEIFLKGKAGQAISKKELAKWQGRVMKDLAREYSRYNWVMQIHFGAIRSNNTRLFKLLGPDIGTDSIVDQPNIAESLNGFLDSLDVTNQLPKTILYNLNPMLNELVASTCANFQSNSEGIKNKIQFGAAWWFNDTFRGMVNQLETLSDQGILMHFVGMLTDSRSFISYPRHEYFRRILCNFIGEKIEAGYYPSDQKMMEKLVKNITYWNALEYLDLPEK